MSSFSAFLGFTGWEWGWYRLLEMKLSRFPPAIAIGLFAGLRPEAKLWPLDWESINIGQRIGNRRHEPAPPLAGINGGKTQ